MDVSIIPPLYWVKPTGKDESVYRELIPPLFLNIHNIDNVHQHHDFMFAAKSGSADVIPENKDDDWLWLTQSELTKHKGISDHVKEYAQKALETVASYS